MFLVALKKKFIMEFIFCRSLNSQYFWAPKSGAPKMRAPTVSGIAGGGVPTKCVGRKFSRRGRSNGKKTEN